MHKVILLLVSFFSLSCCGCISGPAAGNGALVGGAMGAPLGAVIGSQNGRAGTGALVGGAIGALVGNNLGAGVDQQNRLNASTSASRQGISFQEVISMSQRGIGEDVIITQIQTAGVVSRPSSADLIYLKDSGVSDRVIQALQVAPLPVSLGRPPSSAPVIVEEHYYGPPRSYCHPHFHRRAIPYRHRRPGRSGTSLTFSHRF